MPIITYPTIVGAWSESLTPNEGFWSRISGEVYLDMLNKVEGEASIRTYAISLYYAASWFTLNDGAEFDATLPNSKLKFVHALEATFNGNCNIILYDREDRSAARLFGTQPNAQWESKEFPLGSDQGWDVELGFDWTHIKKIRLDCWFTGAGTGNFWVDAPHFEFEVVMPTLRVVAKDVEGTLITGKSMQLTNPSGYSETYPLPFGPVGISIGEWAIKILDVDFIKWEDGSTENLRSFNVEYGRNYIFTAIFEAGNGEVKPFNTLPLIIGAIGIGAIVLIAYYSM